MVDPKEVVSLRLLLIFAIGLAFVNCASAPREKPTLPKEKDPQYQYELAQTALRYGLEDEAIKYLNQASALDPNHYPSFYLLGVIQSQKRNFFEAERAFRKCLELKPDQADAHLRLGVVLEEMLELAEAEEEYKKAYTINGNVESLINLAKLYYDQKKLDLALETVEKATEKDNRSFPAFNLQGVILNELGRYAEAVSSFRNALKIDPQSDVARINLAVGLINTGNLKEARELLEKTLERVKDQNLRKRILEYLEKIMELSSGDTIPIPEN
ncbi:MAG: tetratricopeptide repeat protein [Clostridiales bacterium]|nr:tetratricopeptide repeat protein [Clostridiales bacterium]